MTFDEFVLAVKYRPTYVKGYERYGQALSNQLYSERPDLYSRMEKETEFDPFYSDKKHSSEMRALYYWLRDNWDA